MARARIQKFSAATVPGSVRTDRVRSGKCATRFARADDRSLRGNDGSVARSHQTLERENPGQPESYRRDLRAISKCKTSRHATRSTRDSGDADRTGEDAPD